MKLAFVFLIGLVAVMGGALANAAADSDGKDAAVVEFTDKTKVGNSILQGKYYFEHDDGRMARGEACMFVYSYADGKPDKLVVSFHCKPVPRPEVRDLVVTVAMTYQPDIFELKEIQFKGSKKGHLVP